MFVASVAGMAIADDAAHEARNEHVLVAPGDIARTDIVTEELAPLADGEVRLRIDTFSLTANNVTYAAFGEMMGYWKFFPAPEGWGRVPVWGFADISESTVDELAVGERIYGYFPMSTHLTVTPAKVGPTSFVDAAEHRAALPPVYNGYTRVAADPGFEIGTEDDQMLFRPLFTTSFLIDAALATGDELAEVALTSASSKTALALAHLLHASGRARVVGFTSPSRIEQVESTGVYDQVIGYDAIADWSPVGPSALIDFAGNSEVVAEAHTAAGTHLLRSVIVGGTHWEALGGQAEMPGPDREFFFAPDHIVNRIGEWGREEYEARLATSWAAFIEAAADWIAVDHAVSAESVAGAWVSVVQGDIPADRGLVVSLWE